MTRLSWVILPRGLSWGYSQIKVVFGLTWLGWAGHSMLITWLAVDPSFWQDALMGPLTRIPSLYIPSPEATAFNYFN